MPARILVLEPNSMELLGFRAALAAAGYAVGSAADPAEAAERLGAETYDLVLIGLGQEAAAGALETLTETSPPIVVLTALPDCVIASAIRRPGPKPSPDLPVILEALTRYKRFAPTRPPADQAELDRLLADWAKFERMG